MAYYNQFEFAPAPWLPIQDRQVLDSVGKKAFDAHIGKAFDNPDFELSIVPDVNNYFAIDLFCRIRCSDVENKKLVVILPSPENAVFISVVENLNKYQISCRNVHVFFLYEYANEKGEVAPWQSPYSRSGHFMRYFYNRLDEHLRMSMSQILHQRKRADVFRRARGRWRCGCCVHGVELVGRNRRDRCGWLPSWRYGRIPGNGITSCHTDAGDDCS